MSENATGTPLGPAGYVFLVIILFGPGLIASFRKDPDAGRIWLYGLVGPLTLYYLTIKAFVWAFRPSGVSLDDYKKRAQEAKSSVKAQKRVKGGTGALVSTVENGDQATGKVVYTAMFGFGRIRLYKNGYIYVSTRMSNPEKLVAISSNTDLAIGQKQHIQLGGAMLTIVTEESVNTIKEGTYGNSDFFTPATIKTLQELVTVGNALIGK